MKVKTYFISYSFCTGNDTGFGYVSIDRDEKIKDMKDLKGISDILKEEFGYTSIAILNYKKMKKQKKDGM